MWECRYVRMYVCLFVKKCRCIQRHHVGLMHCKHGCHGWAGDAPLKPKQQIPSNVGALYRKGWGVYSTLIIMRNPRMVLVTI